MKYSDLLCIWLKKLGYTHCFYLAGGNIMHLLESASRYFVCIPTVHEIAAGIAAEYFNEVGSDKKAFVLVTAGPGLTNVVTAIAGAFLESRELLVIGGQVKCSDLSHGSVRQRGIQEIAGVEIVQPITKKSLRLSTPMGFNELKYYVNECQTPRKGPVFIEIPLDIQAATVSIEELTKKPYELSSLKTVKCLAQQIDNVAKMIQKAKRPVILIGGGISRKHINVIYDLICNKSLPFMTTWNGADRIGADHQLYFGRPNTWGMRYSNILLQQADILIAVGTRLGLQQTGFNWQEFLPLGKVVQVECDMVELDKGHPKIDVKICAEANHFLINLLKFDLGDHRRWLNFCNEVKQSLPLIESCNKTSDGYISPYCFYDQLSKLCKQDDVIIPCSSGGAFTVAIHSFLQKKGQIVISNKGLASMGYGLSGAIGSAVAMSPRRTILFEGDGGFAQNIQEIGTAVINKLNLKMFIFEDRGYASIRMTQSNYFNGKYVGCDTETGLGLPNWEKLFAVYDVPCLRLSNEFHDCPTFLQLFNSSGVIAFLVPIDPKQTYFPKITSKITATGSMESNPIHLMSPALTKDVMCKVGKFLIS